MPSLLASQCYPGPVIFFWHDGMMGQTLVMKTAEKLVMGVLLRLLVEDNFVDFYFANL